jgi:hypothetical protein
MYLTSDALLTLYVCVPYVFHFVICIHTVPHLMISCVRELHYRTPKGWPKVTSLYFYSLKQSTLGCAITIEDPIMLYKYQ